jgi:hypothetical protein
LGGMNICLLSKLLWKLENEEGLWQSLILNKYYQRTLLVVVTKKADQSHFSIVFQRFDMFFPFKKL